MTTQKSAGDEPMTLADKANLGLGILAIVFLVAALLLGYLPPNITKGVPEWVQPNARNAGLAFMGLYVVSLLFINKELVAKAFGHKNAQSGANIALQVVALVAVLSALNYWGTRHHGKLDLTENKAYSLSDQTKKILAELKEPIKAYVFVKATDPAGANLSTLWKQYADASDKVKLEVIDIDRDPARARQEKVTTYGTTILERGERKTTITGTQEQDITSAILKVTQTGQKVVYFLTGHGEAEVAKFDPEGISSLKDALEKQNYKIDTINLFSATGGGIGQQAAAAKVPSDAAVLVIAGPTKPFAAQEVDAVRAYLAGGGRVILGMTPAQDLKPDAGLNALLKEYGIEARADLVLDPKLNLFGDIAAPAVQKFPAQAIVQPLNTVVMPTTRSFSKLATAPAGVTVTPLIESSADAWGETNLRQRPVAPDAADAKGPVALAMLAEKDKTRLVVFGTMGFATNRVFANFNNGDLAQNAVNWMADENSLVAIPPKDNAPRSVELLPYQYNAIFFATTLGIPLLLLFGAGFVWWRRR